jgi:hypothetical protein
LKKMVLPQLFSCLLALPALPRIDCERELARYIYIYSNR